MKNVWFNGDRLLYHLQKLAFSELHFADKSLMTLTNLHQNVFIEDVVG